MKPDLTPEEILDALNAELSNYPKLTAEIDRKMKLEAMRQYGDQQARKAFEASRKPRVPAAVSIINNYVSYLDYDHYKNEK